MPIQAQTVQYGPWNMGVRYDVPAEDVPANGLHGMENTRLTQSAAIERVLGTASYESQSAISGTPTLTACGEFRVPGGSEQVFIVAGDTMYRYNSGWSEIMPSSGVTITAGNDNTFEWCRAFNTLVLTNGVNGPIKWVGGSSDCAALDVDSRFTTAEHTAFFDNRVWMGSTNSDKDRVWYSDIGDPETWGASSFFNFGSPVTGIQPVQNSLVVHTEDFISVLIPTGNATIPYQQQQKTSTDPRNPQHGGSISGRAIVTIPGMNAQVFPMDDGIYMWSGGEVIEKVSYALDVYWDKINKSRLHQSHAVYFADQNEVWFWLPYNDSTNSNNATNMNHVMIMSLKNRYQDENTGEVRFAWYGPLTGATTTFERNCSAIISDKPHAGTFSGKLLDHQPTGDNRYSHESVAYNSNFETGAPAAFGGSTDLRWLYARAYYDGLGDFELTIDQDSQGISGSSSKIRTTGGGGTFPVSLDTDTVGTLRMVSKDIDLSGYDPHSSLKFTNNQKDEPYRVRRALLQAKVLGLHRKPKAGV